MIERLKTIRGNLTYQQLADLLNTTGIIKFDKSKLSKYERGEMKPATDFYTAIAKLGYNVNWLLTGEGEMYITRMKRLKKENEELKHENEAVKKMVAIETIKYIEKHFLTSKGSKKPGKKRINK